MLNLYKFPALVPPMPWIDSQPPQPIVKLRKSGRTVKWKTVKTEYEPDKPRQFIIYLNPKEEMLNPENPEFIHVIMNGENEKFKFDRINPKRKKYEVRVSVLDRLSNESWLSPPVSIKL